MNKKEMIADMLDRFDDLNTLLLECHKQGLVIFLERVLLPAENKPQGKKYYDGVAVARIFDTVTGKDIATRKLAVTART